MTPEKNEGSINSQEMKGQKLELNEQESATSKSSTLSAEEVRSKNTERNRMIFLGLIEAAMRYREGYFREEIEDYAAHLESGRGIELDKAKGVARTKKATLNDRAFHKSFDRRRDAIIINFKNEQEQFNRVLYKKIEQVIGNMNANFKHRFDNYATGFGILAEEFLQAKNTTELLTVCKLYNQGLMDNTFAEIRKQRENEKEIVTADSSRTNDNDTIVGVMQEEQSGTDPNKQGSFNSPM